MVDQTYTLIEGFPLAHKHDIPLDKIGIQRLRDREQRVPSRDAITISGYQHHQSADEGRKAVHAQDEAHPDDGLAFFKLDLPAVEPRRTCDEHARPSQREAHVCVRVDLLEEVGAREELRGIVQCSACNCDKGRQRFEVRRRR